MGESNRQFLALSVMMRCADIDATRDLDRAVPVWPALDELVASEPVVWTSIGRPAA